MNEGFSYIIELVLTFSTYNTAIVGVFVRNIHFHISMLKTNIFFNKYLHLQLKIDGLLGTFPDISLKDKLIEDKKTTNK